MAPMVSAVDSSPSARSRDRSAAQVNAAVASTGSAMATAATSTAEPTVARGLKRMIRNAASYMSPRPSSRSGRAPGLWGAPSMPGGGVHGPGPGGPAHPGAGGGGGGGDHPGGGGPGGVL